MQIGGSFAQILQNLALMMQTHAGFFQTAGWAMYGSCVFIVLMLYGVKIYGQHQEIDKNELFMLLIRVGLCGTFVFYWNSPVPRFGGSSGYQLVANLGTVYANQLENGLATRVLQGLADMYFNMDTPWLSLLSGGINLTEFFTYGCLMLGILALAGTVIWVIALGFYATAMCVLIGPLMIPWLLVPGFEYVFWNWFRSFMSYSFFYPVCAFGFLFVFGNLVLNAMQTNLTFSGPSSAIVYVFIFLAVIMASIGVALKIPSIAASIAGGTSGQSTIWK